MENAISAYNNVNLFTGLIFKKEKEAPNAPSRDTLLQKIKLTSLKE